MNVGLWTVGTDSGHRQWARQSNPERKVAKEQGCESEWTNVTEMREKNAHKQIRKTN